VKHPETNRWFVAYCISGAPHPNQERGQSEEVRKAFNSSGRRGASRSIRWKDEDEVSSGLTATRLPNPHPAP